MSSGHAFVELFEVFYGDVPPSLTSVLKKERKGEGNINIDKTFYFICKGSFHFLSAIDCPQTQNSRESKEVPAPSSANTPLAFAFVHLLKYLSYY